MQEVDNITRTKESTWETFTQGDVKPGQEIAIILRLVARDIDGSHPTDWHGVRRTLEWCLGYVREKTPAQLPIVDINTNSVSGNDWHENLHAGT